MKSGSELLDEQIQAVTRFWGDRPHPHLIVGGSGLSGTIGPAAKWADEYNTILRRRRSAPSVARSSRGRASARAASRSRSR